MSSETTRSSTPPFPRLQWVDNRLVDLFNVPLWANIQSVDIDWSEYLSEVQSLLNSPSKITLTQSFEGTKAQAFINFLDQALLQLRLDDKLWQRGLRLIRKISKSRRIVPSSYILQEDCIHIGEVRYHGGFSVVSDGKYQGHTVAVKHLRMDTGGSDNIFKRLCREIIIWKHLSHPNVLPLLGVSISTDTHCFRILTKWMPNGNIMHYAKSNPVANRLQLLSEVVSAMNYLHDIGIVHGDLKGANIVVDIRGAALVADFGLMTIVDQSTFLSETVSSLGGTYRWMSPELLDPGSFGSNGRSTHESDCYALGMVIYEVLTGVKPFYNVPDIPCILAVLRGERPSKPSHAESLGFSVTLWGLVQSCWSGTASARPTAQQLLDCLSLASPTWTPPAVYPVVVTDPLSTDGSRSTDSKDSLYERVVQGTGGGNSAGILVIPIVVVFLFLSIVSTLLLPIRWYN